jgi:hypothetical protein
MTDKVEVQLLDESGNWRTTAVTLNVSEIISAGMVEVQWTFTKTRVRAVDIDG